VEKAQMSSNKKSATLFIIGALVALLLNFLLEKSNVTSVNETYLRGINSPKVVQVIFSRRDGMMYDVVNDSRVAGKSAWIMQNPFKCEADESKVLRLIDSLSCTRLDDAILERDLFKMGRTLSDIGLDNPRLSVSFVDSAGRTQKIDFGDQTASGKSVYASVQTDSGKVVFIIPQDVYSDADLDVDTLRIHSLCSFASEYIESIDIRYQGTIVRFKNESGVWKIEDSEARLANQERVAEFINVFSEAKISRFIWPTHQAAGISEEMELTDALLATYGLGAENAITLTFKRYDGAAEQVVLGREFSDGLAYAFSSSTKSVVGVPVSLKAKALTDISEFADDRLFPYDISEVKFISLEHAGEKVLLSRSDKTIWHIDAPISAKADQEVVESVLKNILSLKESDKQNNALFVSLNGKSKKISVKKDSVFDLYSFSDFRDRLVLSIPFNSIKRITISKGDSLAPPEVVEYNPDRSSWENATKNNNLKVISKALDEMISQFEEIKALKIHCLNVTPEDIRRYGLEKPYMSIAVDRRSTDMTRINLLIGDKYGSAGRFATLGTNETIFVLPSEVVRTLEAPILGEVR
jgi:hypothetical protein